MYLKDLSKLVAPTKVIYNMPNALGRQKNAEQIYTLMYDLIYI